MTLPAACSTTLICLHERRVSRPSSYKHPTASDNRSSNNPCLAWRRAAAQCILQQQVEVAHFWADKSTSGHQPALLADWPSTPACRTTYISPGLRSLPLSSPPSPALNLVCICDALLFRIGSVPVTAYCDNRWPPSLSQAMAAKRCIWASDNRLKNIRLSIAIDATTCFGHLRYRNAMAAKRCIWASDNRLKNIRLSIAIDATT